MASMLKVLQALVILACPTFERFNRLSCIKVNVVVCIFQFPLLLVLDIDKALAFFRKSIVHGQEFLFCSLFGSNRLSANQ